MNCLNTTINLQTWVVLLDFLGMGAKVYDMDKFTEHGLAKDISAGDDDSKILGEDTYLDFLLSSVKILLIYLIFLL